MCLATSNNLLLVLQDAPKHIFSTNSRSPGQPKKDARTLFSTLHPLSLVIFATATVLAFVLLRDSFIVIHTVKQRLFRNRPGSALRPLATSCAKDYKAHSLQQTSFAESPNTHSLLTVQVPGCFKPVINWANVSSRTQLEVFGEASWFLIGPTFLREPSWKYSSKLYSGSKNIRSTCSGNIHPIGRSLPLIG